MYMSPVNHSEPQQPNSTQYPLRPASKASPIRINVRKSIRLHPVPTVVAALLVLGLGLAVVARHKPNFVSASYIYVSPTTPKTLVADTERDRPYETYIQQTVHSISRYDVIAEALHRLPPTIWAYPGESEQSAVQRLQQSLDIVRVGTTYQVEIGMDAPRPEHLAEIVNTVTSVYLEKAKSEEFYGRDERLATLKEERTRVQTDIDSHLAEQNKISSSLGVASFNGKSPNTYDEQNSKLQTDLTAAREQRIQDEAQLAALRSGDSSAPNSALNSAADEAIASDPGLTALKTSLSNKRAALLEQLSGLTPANPQYKVAHDQLAQIEKALADMQSDLRRKAAARLEQKLRTKLNSSSMVETKLQSDLSNGTKQANSAAPRIQRAAEIQSDLDRLQARYAAVDERISNLELESSSPGSVHLFQPAMTPLAPEKSKIIALVIAIFPALNPRGNPDCPLAGHSGSAYLHRDRRRSCAWFRSDRHAV